MEKAKRKTKTSSEVKERWNAKNYERLEIRVKKGKKQLIKNMAESKEMSINNYVIGLVAKDFEKNQKEF